MDIIKSSFTYHKLREDETQPIRLLKVYPSSDFKRRIECELLHSSLKGPDRIEFEALSYTWGNINDPTNRGEILLYGQKHEITKNLESALRHLRLEDEERILWVDSVCINQADLEERSKQVLQMRDIYSPGGATQVLVWLGEEGTARLALEECATIQRDMIDSSRLHKVIEKWIELQDECTEEWMSLGTASKGEVFGLIKFLTKQQPLEYPLSYFDEWNEKMTRLIQGFSMRADGPSERVADIQERKTIIEKEIIAYQQTFKACQDLLIERPWWSRAWIVQEVLHAGRVMVYIGRIDPILLDDILASRQKFFEILIWSNTFQHDVEDQNLQKLEAVLMVPLWYRYIVEDLFHFRQRIRNQTAGTISGWHPILSFRQQKATDERDKIYAFTGLFNKSASLVPDYSIPKPELYIKMTRLLYQESLKNILAVECGTRKVRKGGELPSWVPDFTVTQEFAAWIRWADPQPEFHADLDFPGLSGLNTEPYWEQRDIDPLLILRGIHIGFVTAVYDVELRSNFGLDMNTIRLLQYSTGRNSPISIPTPSEQRGSLAGHREPSSDEGSFSSQDQNSSNEAGQSSQSYMFNTSWAPYQTQIGDIIIVAAGCDTPIVLRKDGDMYLLIGGVWLIDSELEIPKNEKGVFVFSAKNNPGYSRIMYGAACAGKTLEDVQQFTLC